MGLPSDLISEFVKITNDSKPVAQESTVYGTTVIHDGETYVKLDGSDLLTPVLTTADVGNGERVTVMIKNHSATITGSISNPSAGKSTVTDLGNKISEFEIAIGNWITTEQLDAEKARINALETENVNIKKTLNAAESNIVLLKAEDVTINKTLEANNASIQQLQTDKLDVTAATASFAQISELNATNVKVNNLTSTYSAFHTTTTQTLEAIDADITKLETEKLSVEDASVTYANIDFSNIGQAAMEYFYANSGLIENVTVSNGTITGVLAGVTIKGDNIEANTLKADKLVIRGEDGLYYKLNTDGNTVDAEQTVYNSLDGSVITAKSITATKVNVDDLVAFDATIGGFNITENSIFSEVKDSNDNTTRGIYMDTDGQINFGDANNYIKYYRDEDGNYKLVISADTILYDINGDQHSLSDLGVVGEYVKIGTYDGEPSIELGESDSEFKMVITNTKILFMEGTNVPAYVSNQSLFIKKAVIEEELQQGGFVWKARSNGNLGVMWKGVSG